MEHGHTAPPQQLWRQDAGGLSRSLSVRRRGRKQRSCDADLAGATQERGRREVIEESPRKVGSLSPRESQQYGDYGPRTAENRAPTFNEPRFTEPGLRQRGLAESGSRGRR